MKRHRRSAWFLFLSLPLTLWLCSPSAAGPADPIGNDFPQFTGLMETVLRYSVVDSIPVGYAELGVKPWLDLLDRRSYSLKLSLPLTWGPSFYKWHDDEGHFLGAGLFASLQLKSLPPRFGQWSLNTGIFYVRKDLSAFSQEYAVHADNDGGIGAINISIIY